MLNNHKNSYDKSTDDAILTFNEYMHKFLTLNRELRTDSNEITELLDNVPSVFALPEANTECYFAFTVWWKKSWPPRMRNSGGQIRGHQG